MQLRTQLTLFFAATICISAGGGVFDSVFNNYLDDTFAIGAQARGWLEFPRELPGFLVVLMTGLLCALPVTHVGVTGAIMLAVGMLGMAAVGPHFAPMIGVLLLSSAGMHLLMPVSSAIALGLSEESNRGRRMGQAAAVGTIGSVLGTAAVWALMDEAAPRYGAAFAGSAAVVVLGAAAFGAMHLPHLHQRRARFVYHAKFNLYYLLEALFGARKQVFITFGPWVLIQVYGMTASGIAGLLLTASLIGIVFKPLVGAAIDRVGERTVLILDSLVLAVVCVGYGYAAQWSPSLSVAGGVASACFVLDNLLFACGMGRAVYVARLADSAEEMTSTLAMGVSVNHIASMTIPAAAGVVWSALGYETVFAGAAVLAIVTALSSARLPRCGAVLQPVAQGEA